MLELLDYLRANDFKTFIVSGGGVEFMRNFAEKTYGIPPQQVIGSSGVTQYDETATQKVRMAEDVWNTRDPHRVAQAYTVDRASGGTGSSFLRDAIRL
jgi:hypothetical protein